MFSDIPFKLASQCGVDTVSGAVRGRFGSRHPIQPNLRAGKVPYRCRTVRSSFSKVFSGSCCADRNLRTSFEGINFLKSPGDSVALRLQTKKNAREKHSSVKVWLVYFQHPKIYIQVKTILY